MLKNELKMRLSRNVRKFCFERVPQLLYTIEKWFWSLRNRKMEFQVCCLVIFGVGFIYLGFFNCLRSLKFWFASQFFSVRMVMHDITVQRIIYSLDLPSPD